MKNIFCWRALLCAACVLCGAAAAQDGGVFSPPQNLYGDEIVFDVLRNGEPAGEHKLRFSGGAQRLTVVARTRASVSFYGIFDLPFEYDSIAVWDNGALLQITASYLKGFASGTAAAARKGGGFETGKGETAPAPLFPTNHWHDGVLSQKRVFNTLTGLISQVRITPDDSVQTVFAGETNRRARRHRYDGDLELESWYEENGRWIKMRFHALGGEYEFVCRLCEPRRGARQ